MVTPLAATITFYFFFGVVLFCAAAAACILLLSAAFELRGVSEDESWPVLVAKREAVERRYLVLGVASLAVFMGLLVAYANGVESGDDFSQKKGAVNAVLHYERSPQ